MVYAIEEMKIAAAGFAACGGTYGKGKREKAVLPPGGQAQGDVYAYADHLCELCHRDRAHRAVLQVKRNVADVVVPVVLRHLRLPDVGAVEVIGGLAVAAFVAVAVIKLGLVCRDAVKRLRVFRQQRFLAVADLDAARRSHAHSTGAQIADDLAPRFRVVVRPDDELRVRVVMARKVVGQHPVAVVGRILRFRVRLVVRS